jgi:DNA-binding response OmpR family regulator
VSTFSLLLVENDSDLRERLSQGLSQAGFDVHATSASSAAPSAPAG